MLSRSFKKILALAFVALLFGCGDATRNDQGVTFTFLGWFQDSTGTIGQSGLVSSLSQTGTETAGTIEAVTSFAGLQNNLSDQFIRTTQIVHEYYIPGASVHPPKSAFTFTTIVGPTSGNSGGEFNQDGSLPGSFDSLGSTTFTQVSVITADIRSFINFNRESMPELPFNMIVTSYVKGITSAGVEVSTNKSYIEVLFTPDVVITPSQDTGSTANSTSSSTDSSASTSSQDSSTAGDLELIF